MPFTDRVPAVARETALFVGLEATPGTQVPPTDAGMNLVLQFQASTFNQSSKKLDDPQYRNTRSPVAQTVGPFDPGAFTIPCLVKGKAQSGAPAEPEIDPLLRSLMGIAPGTDTTWFGSAGHRAYKLKGVDAAGSPQPSFTAWYRTSHFVQYVVGATCNQGDFDVPGNDFVKVTFTGNYMRGGHAGTDVVAAADTGTGTALIVSNPKKYFIAKTGDLLYVTVLDPTTYLPKAGWENGIAVNAINYATGELTLASGATRADEDIVAPYLPAGTEVGTPLFGKYGLVKIGTFVDKTSANIPSGTHVVTGVRFTITNNIKYRGDQKDGTSFAEEYSTPGRRETRGEMTSLFYRNTPEFAYKAQADPIPYDYMVVPASDKTGSAGMLVEFHFPRAAWETPNSSGEEEKTASIPFVASATTDYNDEFVIVYRGS